MIAFAPIALVLAAAHALAFLFFGYIALLWEIGSFVTGARGAMRGFLVRLSAFDGLAMAPGLILLMLALGGGHDLRPIAQETSFLDSRLQAIFTVFRFHADGPSMALALVLALAFYVGVGVALRRGYVAIDRRMAAVCLGVAALCLLVPSNAFGVACLQFRFTPALVALTVASLRFADPMRATMARAAPALSVAATVMAMLMVAQIGLAGRHMAATHHAMLALRALLDDLPAGARVLPIADPGAPIHIADHGPSIAVPAADAYVPNLFTFTSPVGVTDAMLSQHLPGGARLDPAIVATAARAAPPADNGYWSEGYFHGWADRYSHIVHMRRPGGSLLAHKDLCLLAVNATAALYATPQGGGCAPVSTRTLGGAAALDQKPAY